MNFQDHSTDKSNKEYFEGCSDIDVQKRQEIQSKEQSNFSLQKDLRAAREQIEQGEGTTAEYEKQLQQNQELILVYRKQIKALEQQLESVKTQLNQLSTNFKVNSTQKITKPPPLPQTFQTRNDTHSTILVLSSVENTGRSALPQNVKTDMSSTEIQDTDTHRLSDLPSTVDTQEGSDTHSKNLSSIGAQNHQFYDQVLTCQDILRPFCQLTLPAPKLYLQKEIWWKKCHRLSQHF